MSNSKRIFTIENITESQYSVITKALELYARLGILQLDEVITDDIKLMDSLNVHLVNDKIDYHINEIKKLILSTSDDEYFQKLSNSGHLKGWSLGIGNERTPNNAKIAYEIYDTLKYNEYQSRKNKSSSLLAISSQPTLGLKYTDNPRVKVKAESERVCKIRDILTD